MKGYIVRYEYDIIAITNNFHKWLEQNNERRIEDGEEPETKDIFNIEEVDMDIYASGDE